MLKWKRKQEIGRVTFSDRTGEVCDAACRAERALEQNRNWALIQGSMPTIR